MTSTRKARRDEPHSGPGVDERWIGTTGGRLWDHMALFVLLGTVMLLAAQLMDDPARNWTATIVLAVLSIVFVTGMWANHRRRAEQRN
jgi:hypothetical protein